MIKIYLYKDKTSSAQNWPIMRQTFNELGEVRGNYKYVVNEDEEADYILCTGEGNIPNTKRTFQKDKRILVMMENPNIWIPSQEYIDYFGIIISPFEIKSSNNVKVIYTQPAVPWFYGIDFETNIGLSHKPIKDKYINLNHLAEQKIPNKNKLLSVMVSGKKIIKGHEWRIEIALELKKYFNNEVDIFGFGWNPVADKKQAIDSYLYSIAIENDNTNNYWTEKIADVILGFSTPIYSGAPNINQYFNQTIEEIEYGIDAKLYVKKISKIIANNPNKYHILENRNKILYEHNLFYHVTNILEKIN